MEKENRDLKIVVRATSLHQVQADLLALPVFKAKNPIQDHLKSLDSKLRGRLAELSVMEKFEADSGSHLSLFTKGPIQAHKIMLFGMGEQSKWGLDLLRKTCAQIAKMCLNTNSNHLALAIPRLDASTYRYNASPEEIAQVMVEGVMLGCYRFTKYKKPKKAARELLSLQLLCADKNLERSIRAGAERGKILARSTCHARNLVNEPPSILTPTALAKRAKEILQGTGIKVTTLAKREIEKLGMNSYLSVSLGSEEPPVLIRMEYNPARKAKKHIVLVGKGVTFDSGGLSIKGSKSMETMKDDMSGAAAVISTMYGLSQLKPDVKVTSIVLATENMPDGRAVKPGDVVKAYNGKTIEILNTDAEGRLTLADGLSYAIHTMKPDHIIDIATLTGACLVALGDSISAILGNTKSIVSALQEAGSKAGEHFWELPLHEDYREQIKSEIADVKNTGGSYGGTLTAALFLSEFVGDCPWVHLDIAGPAWSDKDNGYFSKGGTGVGVRTFLNYLCSL